MSKLAAGLMLLCPPTRAVDVADNPSPAHTDGLHTVDDECTPSGFPQLGAVIARVDGNVHQYVCGPRGALGDEASGFFAEAAPGTNNTSPAKSVYFRRVREEDVLAAQPSSTCVEAIERHKKLNHPMFMVSRVVYNDPFAENVYGFSLDAFLATLLSQ